MEIVNDLKPRQWGLAQFLEDIYNEDSRTVVTKEMICNNFPHDYPRSKEFSTEHNSSVFALMRRDIRAIKKSKGWHHILITVGNKGWKIANKNEAEEFLEREKKTAIKKLALCSVIKDKIKNNGQVTLDFAEITATNYVDTFLEV